VNRRDFLSGTAAAAVLAGCAAPVPTADAEREYPAIGRFVEVDGLKVHYWEAGPSDSVPAVLVHGASGNLRDWTFSIAPGLALRRRVIAFDRPGFGYTERPERPDAADPAVQAAILRDAARKIGVERPIVVGHSWGAALALAWALDAPDEVSGAVSVSGVTMPYTGMARVFETLGVSGVISWLYTEYMKSTIDDGGIERFIARVFRPQDPPDGYASYVGGALALRDATLAANAADIERLNIALRRMGPLYGSLERPVEIIHGAEDFIDPERHAIGLAAALPEARLTMLPGVGHMAHHAAPGVLADALDRISGDARA
jgi:pimeloyl-ACP methyl ester carboxylesterase